MHLNECFELVTTAFENGEFFNPGDHHECLASWFLKSKTNFFGHDLNLPWWFGLGCFSFSFGGVVMLFVKPEWSSYATWFGGIKFPYMSFALMLIFLQGPLSFLADYVHMENDSLAHVADRLCACPLVILEFSKICTMFPYTRKGTFAVYMSCFVFALFSFCKSQMAQSVLDRDQFVFWHMMWHVYPLTGSAVAMFDYFVLGEYNVARKEKTTTSHEGKHKHKLLSTILMEDDTMAKKKI